MKYKKLFIAFTAIITFLIAFSIFVMLWFWGDTYKSGQSYEGFTDFRKEIKIPGLKDGACPQGMTVYNASYEVKNENGEPVLNENGKPKTDTQNYFFISAYFKSKPSRIYVVAEKTGETGYVTLKNTDGSDYTGHCGGVATNGPTLWVSSDNTVYVTRTNTTTSTDTSSSNSSPNIAVQIIQKALYGEEGADNSVTFTSSFNANCNASFLYYYQDPGVTTPNSSSNKLYVGEFYRAGNYETNEKHRLQTPNGDNNTAFAYEYNISNDNKYGLASDKSSYGVFDAEGNILVDSKDEKIGPPKIQKIFSITGEIQGFARTANGIVLSQSYGLKNSHILYYSFNWDNTKISENNRQTYKDAVDKNGLIYDGFYRAVGPEKKPYVSTDNPYVYYIDSANQINDYSIPSMSEGLCTVEGRVYVLFESGAYKYKTFVRQVLRNVYS
ncbi:MAG: hypothetical protein HDQ88_08640, partial [Clostridia bacterium]|nr:hypothetical protein [Clostridia bacterium]